MELESFLLESPDYSDYFLQTVIRTTLVNVGMSDLFARFSTNTKGNSPEFAIKFYL